MAPALSSAAEGGARIIHGRAMADGIVRRVTAATRRLIDDTGITPGLAVILVGNDPASRSYVGGKGRKAKETGFHSEQYDLPVETTEATLLGLVDKLNRSPAIHGILVQLPLPAHIDKRRIIEAIAPDKDVDGFHPINVGRLANGVDGGLVPCTPAGCMMLIRNASATPLAGRSAVVIGRSTIVGRPMAQLLLNADCTVTVAHSRSRDLAAIARQAEILVAAVGRSEMVRGDWIRPGALVIDVGVNRVAAPDLGAGKTRLVGDVAFVEARVVAGAITPVPGGVGPMTIAMLMANTLTAACRQNGLAAPSLAE